MPRELRRFCDDTIFFLLGKHLFPIGIQAIV
jgi:hypothetical protein